MSVIAAALRELMAFGVEGDALVSAIERIELAAQKRDTGDAKSAANARYYQARKARKETESVTETTELQPAESVTETTENALIQSPPRARVRDNNPTKVITGISLSLERVRECAGDALDSMATHPGIANLAPLTGLLTIDPPCEPDEVYGAVSAAAAWHRQRGGAGSMTGWTVARKIALENRDRRLAGAPVNERPHHNPTNAADRRRADTESRRGAWSHVIAEHTGSDPCDDEPGGQGGDQRDGGGYLRLAHPFKG